MNFINYGYRIISIDERPGAAAIGRERGDTKKKRQQIKGDQQILIPNLELMPLNQYRE
jgi:hypothetical protein